MTRPKRSNKNKRRPLLIIVLLLVGVLVFCSVSGVISYEVAFGRGGNSESVGPYGTLRFCYGEAPESLYTKRPVSFMSGKNRLHGYVYGEAGSKGLVVISHGLAAGAESYLAEALYFVGKGWQVLAFDNTGCRSSEGSGAVGISQSLPDLEAALGFAAQDSALKDLPVVLYGHSWGGWAVAAVLDRGFNVSAAVSVAGFATPKEALYDFSTAKAGVFGYIGYPFMWVYHSLKFGDIANISAVDAINNSGLPIMAIHGTEDTTLGYNGSAILAHQEEITNPSAMFVTRDAAGQNGHSDLMFSADANAYTAQKLAEWDAVEDSWPGGVPQDVQESFFAGVDRERAAALDLALFDRIEAFYLEAVGAPKQRAA